MTKGQLIARLSSYSEHTIVKIETSYLREDDSEPTRIKGVIDVDETPEGDILLMQEPF